MKLLRLFAVGLVLVVGCHRSTPQATIKVTGTSKDAVIIYKVNGSQNTIGKVPLPWHQDIPATSGTQIEVMAGGEIKANLLVTISVDDKTLASCQGIPAPVMGTGTPISEAACSAVVP